MPHSVCMYVFVSGICINLLAKFVGLSSSAEDVQGIHPVLV